MTTISFMPELAYAVFGDSDELKTQTRRHISQGRTYPTVPNTVFSDKGRVKWYVGQRLPIKARRTGKALCYVNITELRMEDVRQISFADAVAEQTMRLYPAEQFHLDPIISFLYTWSKLNIKSVPLRRELLVTLWQTDAELVELKAEFLRRLKELPDTLFQAYALSFHVAPGSITQAGREFIHEYRTAQP